LYFSQKNCGGIPLITLDTPQPLSSPQPYLTSDVRIWRKDAPRHTTLKSTDHAMWMQMPPETGHSLSDALGVFRCLIGEILSARSFG